MTKIRYVVTAMVHAEGEVELDVQGKDNIFIKSPRVWPVATVICESPLKEEDLAKIKLMALHQLLTHALAKCTPEGLQVEQTMPINMNPVEGDKN